MAWVNFENGESGGSIRSKINAFLTTVDDFIFGNNKYDDTEKAKVAANVASVAELLAPESTKYTPVAVAPTYQEGQFYYDSVTGSFKAQGPIDGSGIAVGHSMHVHVVNNSGAIIEKGMACRHNGVAAGKVQVVKAQADTFENAIIFGVAQDDIGIGADGALVTFGEISNLNTLGYPTGVPLYLSETIAGTYDENAPDIVSQVGGSLVQDGGSGKLFVSLINNKTLPTVLGGLKDHTPGNEIYAVTTTTQDINDYLITESIVTTVDALAGTITLPNTGKYRANFTASITFPSLSSTRSVTFELYDETGASIEYTYTKNIPRDATEDAVSFSFPFSQLVGRVYKMRIKGSTSISVTFTNVSFDIESVSII